MKKMLMLREENYEEGRQGSQGNHLPDIFSMGVIIATN